MKTAIARVPRRAALLALALACVPLPAPAQTQNDVPPQATPTPIAGPQALPHAGVVPANITLTVTGTPLASDVLYGQIRNALDRAIRPSLRPGATIGFGSVNPWPLPFMQPGQSAAANVVTTVTGDATSAPVSGTTTVSIYDVPAPASLPGVLFLDDDPEYLLTEGLVFRGDVTPDRPARLYYYHSDIGVPRDVDVVLTSAAPARVHVIASEAGPDLDVMSVGHIVSRDFLRYRQDAQGVIVDVTPAKPVVVRHALLLQGEVIAGNVDIAPISGNVAVSVVASAAGASPLQYVAGPRVPYDAHHRHGTFDLASVAPLAASYTVGGPNVAVTYGTRATPPRNIDPTDNGRDLGDYGAVRRIDFLLANPTQTPHIVYLYEKPLGGPVRSTFVVDGTFKEIGCVRVAQPYLVATYRLPAQSTGASHTLTMTDGGSFYPLEFGVTDVMPLPNAPPIGAPDGCSPLVPATPAPAATPTATQVASPMPRATLTLTRKMPATKATIFNARERAWKTAHNMEPVQSFRTVFFAAIEVDPVPWTLAQ